MFASSAKYMAFATEYFSFAAEYFIFVRNGLHSMVSMLHSHLSTLLSPQSTLYPLQSTSTKGTDTLPPEPNFYYKSTIFFLVFRPSRLPQPENPHQSYSFSHFGLVLDFQASIPIWASLDFFNFSNRFFKKECCSSFEIFSISFKACIPMLMA